MKKEDRAHAETPVAAPKGSGPRIVCLLPARNAAHLLPGWLDSAARLADAVVALDDGSTDGTGDVLRSHPLVATVLTNERRDGYLGWHDGRNRNRLLAAAAELQPEWIFSLDADERLDSTDAEALRRFAAEEALAACAYGFKVYRMLADDRYDPRFEWVFRLFRYREGQRFLNRRVDLVPVPTAIEPEAWVLTTIRIQHFAESDEHGCLTRVAKYREVDPEGVFRDYYESLKPLSPGPHPRWAPRDPEEPLLWVETDQAPVSTPRPEVVCLFPARDCASLLSGYFESVSRFADAVVALDDGSTDGTRAILEDHPLVVKLLVNPPRSGFSDWDDGVNRNRLLAAAAKLSPTWIISLDADERISVEDGVALRRFLREEAQPGYGYAFASYRMIGDEDHYDRLDYWACRLFAYEPGHVFPDDRFHAPPIPTAIPRDRWRPTSIRMKHLVSLTEAHRQARWEKFREADPDKSWEPDYAYTIDSPGKVKPWPVRPLGLPVASTWDATIDRAAGEATALDLDGPVLSVAVVVEPGEESEAASLVAGLAAPADPTMQFLVVTRDAYAAGVLRRKLSGIQVVEVAPDLTAGALRNAALHVTRGDYIVFLTAASSIRLDQLEEVQAAHECGHAVVCARAANLTCTSAGWAEFYLDSTPTLSSGTPPPDFASVSFAREPLLGIGGFDPLVERGFESLACRALLERGFTAAVLPDLVLGRTSATTVPEFLRRRYELGGALARSCSSGPSRAAPSLVRLGLDLGRRAGASRRELRQRNGGGTVPDGYGGAVAGLIMFGVVATWLGAVRNKLGAAEWRPSGDSDAG